MTQHNDVFQNIIACIETAIESKIPRFYAQDLEHVLPNIYNMVLKILKAYPCQTPSDFKQHLKMIDKKGPQLLLELLEDSEPLQFLHMLEIRSYRRKSDASNLRRRRKFRIDAAYKNLGEQAVQEIRKHQGAKVKAGINLLFGLRSRITIYDLDNFSEFQALPLWQDQNKAMQLSKELDQHITYAVLMIIDTLNIQIDVENFFVAESIPKRLKPLVVNALNIIFEDLPRQLKSRPFQTKSESYGNRGSRAQDRSLFLRERELSIKAQVLNSAKLLVNRFKIQMPKQIHF